MRDPGESRDKGKEERSRVALILRQNGCLGLGSAHFQLRHAELVSASMARPLVPRRADGNGRPWALKQVQGDGISNARPSSLPSEVENPSITKQAELHPNVDSGQHANIKRRCPPDFFPLTPAKQLHIAAMALNRRPSTE
ncbi:hypothetical protein [Sphingopyxis bauzanensis]|uniref:hypothetical protein n=1 Tax=Sphingopyxis bauzanensis TaxID=651663 RepID=UPI00118182A7|nr:hypothetical protein [Sphingopyxis bauzanensis]